VSGVDVEPLSSADYERLRRATETHREELVVRLAAEVGLRPAEIARVRPADVQTHQRDGAEHYFLRVREADDATRHAYLPASVEHAIRQYVRTADVAADECLVSVTPRRVQMLVAEVGERAADRTGDRSFGEVSTRSLRQYFARQLVGDAGVSPHVVKQVGGWERLASLEDVLPSLDREAVAAAFAGTSLSSESGESGAADTEFPGRFDDVWDRVRAVESALDDATTRPELLDRAATTLADGDTYAVAWAAEARGDTFEVVEHAGESVETTLTEADPVEAAVSTGEVVAASDVHADDEFADLRAHADSVGYRAAAVVPVASGDTTHGVLAVGAMADFGNRELALLADLGRRVGRAVTVAEQRRLLLADTVFELAFETDGEQSFFATAAATHDATFTLEGVVPGEDRALLYFVTLEDASPEPVLAWATDHDAVADARLVRNYGDEALLELAVSGPELATALIRRGATVSDLQATPDGERVVGAVSNDTNVRAIVAGLTDSFPATELTSKRERERTEESAAAFRDSLADALTDKQAAVLQAAYHAGYFEWPRGSTAEELADAIGITSPTLHNHLRRAQQKLLSAFLADETRLGTDAWPAE
jgi:GAF domain-containing protein